MTTTPGWRTCTSAAGCTGIRWRTHELCLAHLNQRDQAAELAALSPGASIDLRGTSISTELLSRLLEALTPEDEDAPRIGDALFRQVTFTGAASFRRAVFTGGSAFTGARFEEAADFHETHFSEDAEFGGARFDWTSTFEKAHFDGFAWFYDAQFDKRADFSRAHFGGPANFTKARFAQTGTFDLARFDDKAAFEMAKFAGNATFEMAVFDAEAVFDEARFDADWSGPLVCRDVVTAWRVHVTAPLRLQIACKDVYFSGARFDAAAVLSLRYAEVDLTDAIVSEALAVISHPALFRNHRGGEIAELRLSGPPRTSVISISGVDAAKLVLTDVDLSSCTFSGAYHLDQIRVEGRCKFAGAPRGWRHGRAVIPVRRWTARKVLAEEAAWRAADLPGRGALSRAGWPQPPSDNRVPRPIPTPAQIAVLYRQLRKALEDGKDTPGAADFYYGEMEARRNDPGTPRGERWLLHAYWLVSGYALRASRALGFLAATATATFLLMMVVGLPNDQPSPQITGDLPRAGGPTVLTEATPDPALTLPLSGRFSAARADKAGLVVVNSVIFRSTGASLTGPGTWIEIVSRIGEPVLLGFAAVAARGRVQR